MSKQIKVKYTPNFFRKLKKLENDLQEEVFEKIELFENEENHKILKVHKLHGKIKGLHSLSVNYHVRIVFEYISNNTALFLTIGNHNIYK